MAQATEHGRLITAAAKRVLAPLTLKQKGRSRLWRADQRFWIINVEFQPSGWSRGSYLNVGAVWLWLGFLVEHRLYDYGDRINGFIQFEDAAQFAPLVDTLAHEAAAEVTRLRTKFQSLGATARELIVEAPDKSWLLFHAAVAAGLVGDIPKARDLLKRLEEHPRVPEREKVLGAQLGELLADPDEFRSHVLRSIAESRATCGLPPDPSCID
jgi:hypothetical protein